MLSPHSSLRFADLRLLHYHNPEQWLSHGQRVATTYSARAALYQLCRALVSKRSKGDVILLPAFHCATLVEAVVRAGLRPLFYRICPDLTIDYADLIEKSRRGVVAVLVIHYYGFPADLGPLIAEQRSGAGWFLIEDCAHSFIDATSLNLNGSGGDFAVFSFYKLLPMQVGGGLRINLKDFSFNAETRSLSIKDALVLTKRLAEEVIDNLDDGIFKRTYSRLERRRVARRQLRRRTGIVPKFETAETLPPVTSQHAIYGFSERLAESRLPWMARAIFGMCDLSGMVAARRSNYQLWTMELHEQVGIIPLLPRLLASVCPWAYPVRIRDRSQWDQRMRAQEVPLFTFGESLHPTVYESDPATLRDALELSNELLSFGVHQGLTGDQIRLASRVVNYSLRGRQGAGRATGAAAR
jgi:perosamine synthetase